jgi:hypothetical protein
MALIDKDEAVVAVRDAFKPNTTRAIRGMYAIRQLEEVESVTDEEQRIFLSAMERELEVCEEIDCEAVREGREPKLTKICKEIKRKVMGALWD